MNRATSAPIVSRFRFPAPAASLAALAGLAALTTSCGISNSRQSSASSLQYAPLSSYQIPAITPQPTDQIGDFVCPYSPNITPNEDVTMDGKDRFKACPSASHPFDVEITGATEYSPMICVIPANYQDANTVNLIPDSTTGHPLMNCYETSGTPVFASFPNANYNSLFIVENPNQTQLMNCLTGVTSLYMCPSYSFGKFR